MSDQNSFYQDPTLYDPNASQSPTPEQIAAQQAAQDQQSTQTSSTQPGATNQYDVAANGSTPAYTIDNNNMFSVGDSKLTGDQFGKIYNPIDSAGKSAIDMIIGDKKFSEVLAAAFSGSGKAVVDFITARQQSRGLSKLQDQKYKYEAQAEALKNQNTSNISPMTSIVKPGVSGRQLVGNQRPPNHGGLIGAVQTRGG